MTAREQYKYACGRLRWQRVVNHFFVVDHEFFLERIASIRADILMKAWQSL